MKLLIIDPVEGRSRAVADELDGKGFEVEIAPNGLYALTMLERARPHVVMARSDVGDMTGLELCSYVRGDDSFSETRVVLIVQNEEEKRKAIDAPSVDKVWTGLAPTLAQRLLQLRDSEREVNTRPVSAKADATFEPTGGRSDIASLLEEYGRERKTGRLTLFNGQTEGTILFEDGWIRHSEFLHFRGIPAIGKLLAIHKAGRADCRFEDVAPEEMTGLPKSIEMTAEHVLQTTEMNFFNTTELLEPGNEDTRRRWS